MRKAFVFATLLVLICSSISLAGIPDPSRSGIGLSNPGASCQYRFRVDGGLDRLTAKITLRDAFDVPVASCATKATLQSSGASTLAFCACSACNPQTASTAANGVVNLVFRKIGGRGNLTLTVTAQCTGNIGIGVRTFDFTSPDLNGAPESAGDVCNGTTSSQTDVVDLGIWAGGLPPGYNVRSDYNCSGSPVDVVDLGLWAGGLGKACVAGCP
jgi:hypothetical protein